MIGQQSARAEYDEVRLWAARQALTIFVLERAHKTSADLGFGWEATSNAPSEFGWLRDCVEPSCRTGSPLPISAEHNESVYLTPEATIAFRLWHDVNHVQRDLSFHLVDELELALWHLSELEREGFGRSSLPWRLLHANLVGQAQLVALAQDFPGDQLRFVRHCVTGGFDEALLREARELLEYVSPEIDRDEDDRAGSAPG